MKSKLTAIVLASALTMGIVAPVTQASAQSLPTFGDMTPEEKAAAALALAALIALMTNSSSSSSTPTDS